MAALIGIGFGAWLGVNASQTNQAVVVETVSVITATNPPAIIFEVSTNDGLTWQKMKPIYLKMTNGTVCTVTTNLPMNGVGYVKLKWIPASTNK